MTRYNYKTYRVEWAIEFINVDQYGKPLDIYWSMPFPTLEEAKEHILTICSYDEHLMRYRPLGTNSNYKEGRIRYRETLIVG
jgi:hypothetical protein